jgi:hypothetical protein
MLEQGRPMQKVDILVLPYRMTRGRLPLEHFVTRLLDCLDYKSHGSLYRWVWVHFFVTGQDCKNQASARCCPYRLISVSAWLYADLHQGRQIIFGSSSQALQDRCHSTICLIDRSSSHVGPTTAPAVGRLGKLFATSVADSRPELVHSPQRLLKTARMRIKPGMSVARPNGGPHRAKRAPWPPEAPPACKDLL